MAKIDSKKISEVWNAVKLYDSVKLQSLLDEKGVKEAFDRQTKKTDYLNLVVRDLISNNDGTGILKVLCEAWPNIKGSEAGIIFSKFLARAFVNSGTESSTFKVNKFLFLADRYIGNVEINNAQVARNLVRTLLVNAKGNQSLLNKGLSNVNLKSVITQEWKDWLSDIVKEQIANGDCEKTADGGCNKSVSSLVADLVASENGPDPAPNISAINGPDLSKMSVVNCSAALSTIGETHVLAPLMKSALAVNSLNATSLNVTTIENYYKTTYRSALSEIKNLPKPFSSIDNFREAVSALVFTVVKTKDRTNTVPENICIKTPQQGKGTSVKFVTDECKLDFAPLPEVEEQFDECDNSHQLGGVRIPSLLYGAAVGVSAALSGAIYCSEVTHASEHLCEYLK